MSRHEDLRRQGMKRVHRPRQPSRHGVRVVREHRVPYQVPAPHQPLPPIHLHRNVAGGVSPARHDCHHTAAQVDLGLGVPGKDHRVGPRRLRLRVAGRRQHQVARRLGGVQRWRRSVAPVEPGRPRRVVRVVVGHNDVGRPSPRQRAGLLGNPRRPLRRGKRLHHQRRRPSNDDAPVAHRRVVPVQGRRHDREHPQSQVLDARERFLRHDPPARSTPPSERRRR